MHRLTLLCSFLLLVLAAQIDLAVASGGKYPIVPRICVGPSDNRCCRVTTNANFERICAGQLCLFKGDDTIEAATVQASLVASVSQVAAKPSSECNLRNYWASIGADFESMKFFFRSVTVTVDDNGKKTNFTLTGGAAVVRACGIVYVVFGSVKSDNGQFSSVPIDYDFDGVKTETNQLFYKYYLQAFRDKDNDVVTEAIEQLGYTGDAKLYVAGFSGGGLAAIYASNDIQKAAGEKPKHIYLFANSKPGNDAFFKKYDEEYGAITSIWWNKLDIFPVLPPPSTTVQKELLDNLPADEKKDNSVLSWGIRPEFEQLSAKYYWRVAPGNPPNNYNNIPEGTCVKATEGSAWSTACPSQPVDDKNFKCGLNQGDHDVHKYFVNIKQCVLPTPNRIIRRRKYWFNPACINDFPVS